jgi:hypothetical protein
MDMTIGVALALALTVFAGAHVAIVGGLARRRAWRKALAALLVPPLAPWWAFRLGMRARAYVWLGAVGAYAACVVVF